MGKQTVGTAELVPINTLISELEAELLRDAETKREPPADLVTRMVAAAEELRQAKAAEARAERALKEAQGAVHRLRCEQLPALLDEAGCAAFTLQDGTVLQRIDEVYANCPKAKQNELAGWMQAHGHGALVKGQFIVTVPKGDDELERDVRNALNNADVEYEYAANVHAGTLKAFCKEQIKQAAELPPMVTVHIQPACNVHEEQNKGSK